MGIIVTNYGVTVNGNFISFETNKDKHDIFLTALYMFSGMSEEELMQYKKDRSVTGVDQFSEELIQVISNVRALKANQMPLTSYSSLVACNYYQDNVINSAPVIRGSAIEETVAPRSSRRR